MCSKGHYCAFGSKEIYIMKKLTIIVLILALVCTGAFASVLQIGATARFGGDITKIEDYKEFKNYDLGVDARLNFSCFSIATNVLFGKNNDNTVLNTILTANLRADMNVVDLAFGVGYALPIEFGSDGVMVDGKPASQTFDVLKNSQLLARVALGVNIGPIALGVDYKIPFNTLIDYFQGDDLKDLDSFKQGKIALSLLVNLF